MPREVGADCLVSVGGGSTTGLGKALAARTGMPHLVVPTTYAGSEVTSLLGETANGEKVTRTGPEIRPEVVVYDVALTTSLPWPVTVTSAVNAMAHAVEALYAADRTDETDRLATDGLGALAGGLRALHHDPDDVDARADLLYGAWLAGRCLEAVGMGVHHKLCHTLGGSFGLPHAATHTVVLPHAMAFNAPAAPEAMRAAAAALGVDDAPSGLQALVARLGGPTTPARPRLRPRRRAAGRRPGHRAALPQPAPGRPRRHRRAAHPRDRGHHDPPPRPVDLRTRRTRRTRCHPPVRGAPMTTPDPSVPSPADLEARRQEIRAAHLRPTGSRPASTARGLHHTALISGDVERTVRFYQDVLGFPLTELIENRDYPGSSHFFFDIGNSNLLAFFDFPGLDVGPYAEVLGGLHHMAISVEPERWHALVDRLTEAGVEHEVHSGVSVYFRDPDGARIELIADPLGEMYGNQVL